MIGIIPKHVSDAIDKRVIEFVLKHTEKNKNTGEIRAALLHAYNQYGVIADIEPVSNPYKLDEPSSNSLQLEQK